MQSEEIYQKFYNNHVEKIKNKQGKEVPPGFKEWLKFDRKMKSGIFAVICPICGSENVAKGLELDTRNTGLRDMRYIEYECKKCGSYFLI
ncbi:MAG: hypothetical protein ACTSPY_11305 [Candidatus Helarchaeota archaeon]